MLNPFANIDWRPARDTLRRFAVRTLLATSAVVLLSTALLASVWPDSSLLWTLRNGVAGVAALSLVGLFVPAVARVMYWILESLQVLAAFLISSFFLGLFYYLFLTPVALLMRIGGRDTLRLKKPEGATQWVDHAPPASAARYYREF